MICPQPSRTSPLSSEAFHPWKYKIGWRRKTLLFSFYCVCWQTFDWLRSERRSTVVRPRHPSERNRHRQELSPWTPWHGICDVWQYLSGRYAQAKKDSYSFFWKIESNKKSLLPRLQLSRDTDCTEGCSSELINERNRSGHQQVLYLFILSVIKMQSLYSFNL